MRTFVITRSFSSAISRHGVVAGTPKAKAIARTINSLLAAPDLPLPGDVPILFPPTSHYWQTPVRSTPFKLVYDFDPDHLWPISLRV